MTFRLRSPGLLAAGGVAALVAAAAGLAQLEPGDRGVPPVDSSSAFEVPGVAVDVAGRTADQARTAAWREAQRRGWALLWGRVHGQPPAAAPRLSDGTLDGLVSGIEVEEEHVGATRYIARLGVLFDRARTGALLGAGQAAVRSQPTLVFPVEWDGGAPIAVEQRSDWQKAWARFRSGGSAIDYVRPIGTGLDPLLVTAAQANRPGRAWWRMLLDQYGAADVVVPIVRLRRLWPGGPVIARFEARHGADGGLVAAFALRVEHSDALPRMLDEGVRRIDAAYADALRGGMLAADPSLLQPAPEPAPEADDASDGEAVAVTDGDGAAPAPAAALLTLQVETPDGPAVSEIEDVLRSVPGLDGVRPQSLAVGGVSVYAARFAGDPGELRTALAARGWRADGDGAVLRLSRREAAQPPPEVTGGRPR